MNDQLALDTGEEDALYFIAYGWDDTPLARVGPVTHKSQTSRPGWETWSSAEKWCYLASRAYDDAMWLGRS